MKNQPPEIARLQAIQSKVLRQRHQSKCFIEMDIGDDAFAFSAKGKFQVIAQDMMVEDVHFKTSYCSPQDLGWKSLAVNFSDLLAKGADLFAVQISLALPSSTSDQWLEAFYEGALQICDRAGVIIAGGDLCASTHKISIDVSVYGFADNLIHRSGLQAGDILYCSGPLGLSSLGFRELNSLTNSNNSHAIERHLRPLPRFEFLPQLQKFAQQLHASIDVSDGLINEILQLQRASMKKQNTLYGFDLEADLSEAALWGGEDYEILIALPSAIESQFLAETPRSSTAWQRIGTVQESGLVRRKNQNGTYSTIESFQGWSHF